MKVFKKVTTMLLALIMCFGIISFPKIKSRAAETVIMAGSAFPRSNDVTYKDWANASSTGRQNTWGHRKLTYVNGTVHKASENTNILYYYDGNGNRVTCYCIEPGRTVVPNHSYSQSDADYFATHKGNALLKPQELPKVLGRVFQYGYFGTVSDTWNSGNTTHANNMAHAMATQFLVWEVIVGERDIDFNHIDDAGFDKAAHGLSSTYGNSRNRVLDGLNDAHPLKTKVLSKYNEIVNNIKNHVDSPSFMSKKRKEAETYQLAWNDSTQKYSVRIKDTNNVLSDFVFKNTTDIDISVSGQYVTFSTTKVLNGEITIEATKKTLGGNPIKSKQLVVWQSQANSNEQAVAYGEPVDDPVDVFIKLKMSTNVTGKISGVKVDENGIGLGGVLIGLFRDYVTNNFSEGNATYTFVTKSDGSFEFTDVPYGKWKVKEIKAPTGYVLNDKVFEINIDNDGVIKTIEIINTFKRVDVEIAKKDPYGNNLAGAEFELEISSDNGKTFKKLNQLTTDNNGEVKFTDLVPTMYYRITETKAPNGFQLLTEPVFEGIIEVGGDTIKKYTVVNTPILELPATGGNSFFSTTICFCTALVTILAIVYITKSKKTKQY